MNSYQEATRIRIELIVGRLQHRLNMDGWWTITHRYLEGHDGDETVDDDGEKSIYGTTAITTASWEYRTATIRWFMPVAALQSDEELELTAIHELVHVLLWPIYEVLPGEQKYKGIDKLNEYTTECIARVIHSALRGGA